MVLKEVPDDVFHFVMSALNVTAVLKMPSNEVTSPTHQSAIGPYVEFAQLPSPGFVVRQPSIAGFNVASVNGVKQVVVVVEVVTVGIVVVVVDVVDVVAVIDVVVVAVIDVVVVAVIDVVVVVDVNVVERTGAPDLHRSAEDATAAVVIGIAAMEAEIPSMAQYAIKFRGGSTIVVHLYTPFPRAYIHCSRNNNDNDNKI